ncbi:alpha/beta-hydrolase [Penicillium malachiteum]|nr:alpha/beta-hydrolase [Penicillium malachiteum]
MSIFFENNGNWSSHGTRPSAIFVNTPTTYAGATATCKAQNETLLSCEKYIEYANLFSYQQYLGAITSDQLLWSSCSSTHPSSWRGILDKHNLTSSSTLLPYLCTNSAPLVDKVDTDYSVFPRVNATSNDTIFEGLRDHMAFRFVGIRFAQPPLDELRFKPSQPLNKTESYLRYFEGSSYGLNPWGNSEDCLYLNVYTPHIPLSATTPDPNKGKPVMFWIYGGGGTQGSGADLTFDGASLASRSDVVVVTFNYRVNIFGLLSLDDEEISGNYHISDYISALRWVKQNIAGFGGNPNNNGIIQSGKSNTATQEVAAAVISPYIEPYCNGTDTERASCLRSLPAETLLDISNSTASWYTVMDGIYSMDYTQAILGLGAQYINSVNAIAGNMLEEFQSLATTSLWPSMDNFTEAVEILISDSALNQAQADAVLKSGLYAVTNETVYNGSTAYTSVYNASVHLGTEAAASWAFKSHWFYVHNRGYALSYYDFYDLGTFPVGKPETPYYRCHSGDLYEVWGTYYIFDQPVRVPEDIYYTNAVQDMWGSFARTGNPNVDPAYLRARSYYSTIDFFYGFEWPQFKINRPSVASLQYPGPKVSSLPYQDHCEVILPEFLNPSAPTSTSS